MSLKSKLLPSPSARTWAALTILTAAWALPSSAWAQYTYVPSTNQNGNWNAANRWTGGPAGTFPNAIDATATVNIPLSTAPTGNYNLQLSNTAGQSITIGSLIVNHDATNTFNTRIGANGNGTLTFQTSAGFASIFDNPGSPTDSTGATNFFAPVTFASDTVFTQNHKLDNNNGSSFTSSANSPGGITAGPGITFTKEGGGNVTFEVAPTAPGTGFQGAVVVNSGAVRVESNVFANASAVTVNSGGQFQLGSGTVTSWSLGTGASLTLNGAGKVAGTINPEGAFRLQNGNATSSFINAIELASDSSVFVNANLEPTPPNPVTFSRLTLTETVSGTGALTKEGAGILELVAANTYAGGTVVNAGTLLVNNLSGSGTGDGPVTVNAGATLGGAGSIAGVVSFVGGTLAPGNSPGLITLGGAELDATSIADYELAFPDIVDPLVNDLTQVNGDLTLDGVLNVVDLPGFGAGVYRLFNYTGLLLDNGLDFGHFPAGFIGAIDLSTPNEVNLQVGAVPEPSSFVLAGFGLLGLAVMARRRRTRWGRNG